jgi:hypothetical protein
MVAMGILRKLDAAEQAEIDELSKAHERSRAAHEAAGKLVADDATMINAWVVKMRRKHSLQDGDMIRPDHGDIVRPDGGVTVAADPITREK